MDAYDSGGEEGVGTARLIINANNTSKAVEFEGGNMLVLAAGASLISLSAFLMTS